MKNAIIIGATSGIGLELFHILLDKGWNIGIASRNETKLYQLQQLAPTRVKIQILDVTNENSATKLRTLIESFDKIDLYIHSSGVGYQNMLLDINKEISTIKTNCLGFSTMICTIFEHMCKQGFGHIAVISSIAATKGIGVATSYSSSKSFQSKYIEGLEQLAKIRNNPITFTDIRPGFVNTALLNDGKKYPLLMEPKQVAGKIYNAIVRKKHVCIIDKRYRFLVFFWRLIPRRIWIQLPIKLK